jgi:acyl-CoA hydrolase
MRTSFALGIEALVRFVRGEPLRRVHECVFGVFALESESVDPRLQVEPFEPARKAACRLRVGDLSDLSM